MEADRSNRNCYSCGGFEHLVRNCRNRRAGNRIRERRRLEYDGNNRQREMIKDGQNDLNGEQDLILLN